MDRYEIFVTPDAENDLYCIRDYIMNVLQAPGTALHYIQALRSAILTLDTMPKRNPIIDAEPWKSHEIRFLVVKSFYVYYRIDTDQMRVYILNVIYSKREQLKQLAKYMQP